MKDFIEQSTSKEQCAIISKTLWDTVGKSTPITTNYMLWNAVWNAVWDVTGNTRNVIDSTLQESNAKFH